MSLPPHRLQTSRAGGPTKRKTKYTGTELVNGEGAVDLFEWARQCKAEHSKYLKEVQRTARSMPSIDHRKGHTRSKSPMGSQRHRYDMCDVSTSDRMASSVNTTQRSKQGNRHRSGNSRTETDVHTNSNYVTQEETHNIPKGSSNFKLPPCAPSPRSKLSPKSKKRGQLKEPIRHAAEDSDDSSSAHESGSHDEHYGDIHDLHSKKTNNRRSKVSANAKNGAKLPSSVCASCGRKKNPKDKSCPRCAAPLVRSSHVRSRASLARLEFVRKGCSIPKSGNNQRLHNRPHWASNTTVHGPIWKPLAVETSPSYVVAAVTPVSTLQRHDIFRAVDHDRGWNSDMAHGGADLIERSPSEVIRSNTFQSRKSVGPVGPTLMHSSHRHMGNSMHRRHA